MAPILLLTNAEAGSSDREAVDTVVRTLRDGGEDVLERSSGGPDELARVLRERDGRDVVVAGGDGSLHALVAALDRLGDLAGPAIGVIPLGTGNDFARGTGVPLDPEAAARLVLETEPCEVDLVVDSGGEVVVNAVHVGIGAEAAERAAPFKKAFGAVGLGTLGYGVGAFVAAVGTRGWPVDIVVDGEVVCRGERILQAGIANGATIGGGAELAPGAEPVDGKVAVVVSLAVGPLSRFRYGWGLARSTHERDRDVLVRSGQVVTVRGRDGTRFRYNADGELSEPVAEREWSLRTSAMRMFLPEQRGGV